VTAHVEGIFPRPGESVSPGLPMTRTTRGRDNFLMVTGRRVSRGGVRPPRIYERSRY
jgi:hypothetical protein